MKGTVLVLDNDHNYECLYQTELEKEGLRVFTTTDPKQAFTYIQKYGADVIVLDMAFRFRIGLSVAHCGSHKAKDRDSFKPS